VTTSTRAPTDAGKLLTPPAGNPRFPLFDSLRALAALSVVLFHVGEIGGGNRGGALWPVGASLSIGVPIFFAISGFLLYRPFANAALGGRRRPRVLSYARRRVLRIIPAYWVALTALGVAFGWSEIFGADFWRYYGLNQIYTRDTFDGGMGVAWTLCIEATFYALLPAYAIAMEHLRAGRTPWRAVQLEVALLVVLGIASGVARALIGEAHGYAFPTAMLPGTFLWFVPGMLLALLSVAAQQGVSPIAAALLRPRNGTVAWVVALAAFGELALCWDRNAPRWLGDDLVTPLLTFTLLLPAVAGPAVATSLRTVPQWVLARRPLLWLGMISYGIYLYHATIMAWLEAHDAARIVPFSHWLGLAVTSVVAAAIAGAGSWYVVEQPALRRKFARPRTVPRPAVVAPAAESVRAGG